MFKLYKWEEDKTNTCVCSGTRTDVVAEHYFVSGFVLLAGSEEYVAMDPGATVGISIRFAWTAVKL